MLPAAGVPLLKFGPFKVDLRAGELHKNGTRLRLQEKPLRVLELLAKLQGQLVTREELKKHLWPDDDFVDFETGLNTAVKKLRGALADNADNPRYIETIPRRGYRFLVPVEIVSSPEKPLTASVSPPISSADAGSDSVQPSLVQSEPPAGAVNSAAGESARRSNRNFWIWAVAGAVALGLAVASVWLARSRPVLSFQLRDSVLIADFENQTSDPRLGRALQTAFTVSVDQSRYANVFARTRVGPVLRRMGRADTEIITPSIGIEICQREGIRGLLLPEISQAGQEYMLTVQLIDPTTGSSVRSYSQRSNDENHLLNALDKISEDVRQDLGESLYQIHRADRPLAQVTTPSLEALKDYTEGQQLWHSGKYDQAVARYQAALAADPDFVMANASLGDAYYSLVYNQSANGQEYYEKALANSSRVTERERESIQARYAVDLDQVPDAIQRFEHYLQNYPDDWAMRFGFARLLRTHGHPLEAIEQDKQILRLSPNDAHTYIDMATAYHHLDQLTQSLEAYNAAFQADSSMRMVANINREYGFTLVQSGQVDKAENLFTGLLADSNLRESGLRSLGLLDLYRGQYRSAQKQLNAALQIDLASHDALAVARVRFLLSLIAAGEGRKRDQIAQLDIIMANFSALDAKVQYGSLVGQAYARAGEVSKAEKILTTIAPLANDRARDQAAYLRILKAEIFTAHGNTAQALQFLEHPQLEDRESTEPITLDALAHTYQMAGDIPQAIAWYEKLLKSPTSTIGWEPQQLWFEDHFVLAEDYLLQGQRAQALSTIEALLQYWKEADKDLPLKKQSIELRSRLLAER